MTSPARLFTNARLADGRLVDISVGNGRIASMRPAGADPAATGVIEDLGGKLVIPGFVEGHIHLDFSFLTEGWRPHKPCAAGFDVRERVALQAENFLTAAPLAERARAHLELCLAKGSTRIRSHVMVDGAVRLSHVEALLETRAAHAGLVDLQLVAFPQNGILTDPGTADLLDEALAMGCDLIGGLDPASFDRDVKGHLDAVFGLAEKHGAPVDIHLHDGGELGAFELEEIAARTRALGMEGKVAVSHAYALGDIPESRPRPLAARLAAAGVSIMTAAPGARAMPPVAALRAAGVAVFAGNDNIRDSWSPYGDGDMLRRAMLIAYRAGFRTDEELGIALDLATGAGAAALGLEDYGLRPGAIADFIALDAANAAEAVAAVPAGRRVYRAGRPIAENGVLLASPSGR